MTDQEFDQLVAAICTLAQSDEDWFAFLRMLSDIEMLPEVTR